MKRKLTPETLAEARALRADDDCHFWTYARLAERYGVSAPGICNALNRTSSREHRRVRQATRNAEWREAAAAKRRAGLGEGSEHASTRAAAMGRLKEIPADTRDFTARFFGDPLPGRSAWDMRKGES